MSFWGHLPSTKYVTTGDGVRHACRPIYVALHTDITRRVGTDDEHEKERVNTQHSRRERENGLI